MSNSSSGFTFIEILVASSMASIILIMTYTSYRSIVKIISDMSGYSEFYENVSLAISKIDRDISNAYINLDNTKIFFISESDSGNQTKRFLKFITINHRDFVLFGDIKKSAPVSDIHQVNYSIIPDPKIQGLFILVRSDKKQYGDDHENTVVENKMLPNVVDLRFEFRQQNDWLSKWDSRENKRFPQAVRTTLSVKDYKGKVEVFSFISYMNMIN